MTQVEETARIVGDNSFPVIDTAQILAEGGKFVQLDDGRIVEYSVMGSDKPDAKLLVSGYFAMNGQRDMLPQDWINGWEQNNTKCIHVSIPGLGKSSFHPGSKISDWPRTDLEPVLQAEGITENDAFYVYGASYGCLHAMAMAQHFGPERVVRVGLRCPYLPRPLSEAENLPNGQFTFPKTDELQQNTLGVKLYRHILSGLMSNMSSPGPVLGKLMSWGIMGKGGKSMMKLKQDYPDVSAFSSSLHTSGDFTVEGIMYMMAEDVALDCPGLDITKIQHTGDQTLVWYAEDDDDCPPSHGKWLAEHFGGSKNCVTTGYGHNGGCFLSMSKFVAALTS